MRRQVDTAPRPSQTAADHPTLKRVLLAFAQSVETYLPQGAMPNSKSKRSRRSAGAKRGTDDPHAQLNRPPAKITNPIHPKSTDSWFSADPNSKTPALIERMPHREATFLGSDFVISIGVQLRLDLCQKRSFTEGRKSWNVMAFDWRIARGQKQLFLSPPHRPPDSSRTTAQELVQRRLLVEPGVGIAERIRRYLHHALQGTVHLQDQKYGARDGERADEEHRDDCGVFGGEQSEARERAGEPKDEDNKKRHWD